MILMYRIIPNKRARRVAAIEGAPILSQFDTEGQVGGVQSPVYIPVGSMR